MAGSGKDASLVIEGQLVNIHSNWDPMASASGGATWRNAGEVDEDYEDMARILDRLRVSGHVSAAMLPRVSLACTCMNPTPSTSAFPSKQNHFENFTTHEEDNIQHEQNPSNDIKNYENHPISLTKKHLPPLHGAPSNIKEPAESVHMCSSDDESSSDDEESFKLTHVMRALALYQRKPIHKRGASLGALRTLIRGYVPQEDIQEDNVLTLLDMLEGSDDGGVREMALLTMRQVSMRAANAAMLIRYDLVAKLVLYLELETMAEHHESVALTLEQILKHPSSKHKWHEVMSTQGGAMSIITHAQSGHLLPVRLACARVMLVLSGYEFYAKLMIQHCIELITSFNTMNSDFQEVYTGLLANLVLYADERTVRLLNTGALPAALNMLQQGPCAVQQQALVLLSSLVSTSTGLNGALQDPHALPMILSALNNTECRKTRQNAAMCFAKLTATQEPQYEKQILLHIDAYHHETEQRIDEAAITMTSEEAEMRAKQSVPEMSLKEKMDRAVGDIGKDLVQLISKLGKMEQDLIGNTVDIHLAPCFDTDQSDLSTLCHVLQITVNLLRFKVDQVKMEAFETEHRAQRDILKSLKLSMEINHNICKILVKQHILCIVDLLSVYTQKLLDVVSICSKPLQSMGGMSKSQLLFQAWGSQSEAMSSAGKVNIATIFDPNEAELVTHLLQVLSLIAFSTVPVESESSETLENKIKDQIDNYTPNSSITTAISSTKLKKKNSKHFHSKTACELCRKDPNSQHAKQYTSKVTRSTTPDIKCEHIDDNDEGILSADALKEKYMAALGKYISSQQRDIRMTMYEAGVVESVGPWLMSADQRQQMLVLATLRSMVQPVQERLAPSPPKQPKLHQPIRTKMAAVDMTSKERDQAMDVALYQMSTRMKQFIEDALGRHAFKQHPNSPRSGAPENPEEVIRQNGGDGKERLFYKVTDHASRAVQTHERRRDFYERHQSGSSSYRPEHYDRFARANSSLSLRSGRSNSSRPTSAKSSAKTAPDYRPQSAKKLRRTSKSPRRNRRRPSSAAPTTKPQNGYQVIVKPEEKTDISITKSISQLSSSSSDSLSDVPVTPKNFPSAIYDHERSRSEVSDEGHVCETGRRPSTARSARGGINDLHLLTSRDNTGAPIGQRYPKRVWVPWKPQLNHCQPLGEQCRCLVAMVIGKVIVQQVCTNKDVALRKRVLDFMDQYVKHGETESHMKLSEQGVMPRMVDFLRVNTDDTLLEMMGLSVVSQLLNSDSRLAEVFNKNGGSDLLVTMTSCSTGPLRDSVKDTLQTVTKANKQNGLRKGILSKKKTRQADIWDQIMQRWKQEDKMVTEVLQKFNS